MTNTTHAPKTNSLENFYVEKYNFIQGFCVNAIALKYGIRFHDAMDLHSQLFINVSRWGENYDGRLPIKNYLFVLYHNLCKSHLRKTKTRIINSKRTRKKIRNLEELKDFQDDDIIQATLTDNFDHTKHIEQQETINTFRFHLNLWLGTISEKRKNYLTLRHFQNLNSRQITELHNTKHTTVRTNNHYSLKKLKEYLIEHNLTEEFFFN